MITWLDEHPWFVPVSVFALAGAASVAYTYIADTSLSFTNSALRQQVYASLTGSSSSLLGFLIAAVTVLAAFGKRPTRTPQERVREDRLAIARTKLVILLLVAAFFMLVVLLSASLALSLSNQSGELALLDGIILSSAAAGVVGLVHGGLALGLAVAERGRE